MTEQHDDRIVRLGDRIELAVAGAARAEVARGRRVVVGLVAVAVAVSGGLAALALPGRSATPGAVAEDRAAPVDTDVAPPPVPPPAGALAAGVVARGMVDGARMFEATDPSCTTEDGVTFACELAHSPTAEVTDDYAGVVQTFVDAERRVAGGCVGTDPSGRTWTCLAGEAAVEAGYLASDLLGQYQPVPGRG